MQKNFIKLFSPGFSNSVGVKNLVTLSLVWIYPLWSPIGLDVIFFDKGDFNTLCNDIEIQTHDVAIKRYHCAITQGR